MKKRTLNHEEREQARKERDDFLKQCIESEYKHDKHIERERKWRQANARSKVSNNTIESLTNTLNIISKIKLLMNY